MNTTATSEPTPVAELPLPSRLLLKPHSHSTAFQSPGFPRQAPGTTPAAAELPALAMFFVSRFTSLSGVTRRDRHRMHISPEPASFAPQC